MTYRLTYGATPNELTQLPYPVNADFVLGFSSGTAELKKIELAQLPYPVPVVPLQEFKSVSGNYTLLESDHGKIIRISGVSTITLPSGLLDGLQLTIFNETNNIKTFSTSGTLLAKGTLLKNQYGAVYLTHVASNVWLGIGDLSSV